MLDTRTLARFTQVIFTLDCMLFWALADGTGATKKEIAKRARTNKGRKGRSFTHRPVVLFGFLIRIERIVANIYQNLL